MICVCRSPSIYSLNWNLCSKLPMLLAQNPKVLSRLFIISTKILKIFHGGAPTARLYFRIYVPRVPMNIQFNLQRTTADNSAVQCTFIYNYISVWFRWKVASRCSPGTGRSPTPGQCCVHCLGCGESRSWYQGHT